MDWSEEKQRLEKLLVELKDLNSSFPATREFLQARGLSHVNELDRQGTEELIAYLKETYQGLLN